MVVKIKTPGAIHPIAIEYDVDERTKNFDITDGEGYISLYGELWHSAEETQSCNVCLKAFTNYIDVNREDEETEENKTTQGTTEENTSTGTEDYAPPEINTESKKEDEE